MLNKKKEKWELPTIRIIIDKIMLENFQTIFRILELKMSNNHRNLSPLIDKMKEVNKKIKTLNVKLETLKVPEVTSEEALIIDPMEPMREETSANLL